MDFNRLQCSGCGSSNVVFDPQSRILICNQCGKNEYYSRATLNASGRVVFGKQNALKFFSTAQFDNAKHYARDVLNVSMDNAPALFIMAYHEEFVEMHVGAMDRFFEQVLPIALEYDEVREMKKLVITAAHQMSDYEPELIKLFAMNMQSDKDADELCALIDQLCPYFISKRTSSDFLTSDLIDLYSELAEHCVIPKTCFALLKAIETNPDSPFIGDSFYLRSKSEYFYNHYVMPVGHIIESMKPCEYKQKFALAYQKKKLQYEQRMIK